MKKILILLVFAFVAKHSYSQFGYEEILIETPTFNPATDFAGIFTNVEMDDVGNIYIQTSSNKYFRYDGNQWIELATCFNQIPQGVIRNAILGKDGQVYSTYNSKFFRFNENQCEILVDLNLNNIDWTSYQIQFFGNRFYISTTHGGFVIEDNNLVEFISVNNVPGINFSTIFFMLPDDNGVLWLGTTNGLLKRLADGTFVHFNSGNSDLKNPVVTDMKKVGINNYIITTLYDVELGLYRFDGNTFSCEKNRFEWYPFNVKVGLDHIAYYNEHLYIPSPIIFELSNVATNFYGYNFVMRDNFIYSSIQDFILYRKRAAKLMISETGDLYIANRYHPNYNKIYKLKLDEHLRIKTPFDFDNLKSLDINNNLLKVSHNSIFPHLNFGSPSDNPFLEGSQSNHNIPKFSNKGTMLYSTPRIVGKNSVTNELYSTLGLGIFVDTNHISPTNTGIVPGPLLNFGSFDYEVVSYYNRIWKVNKCDILNFIYHYNNGNVQNGTYQVPKDMLEWPANPYPINHTRTLAPFVDVNNDGFYNPYDGDYPEIKGDQMLWWIGNDQAFYIPQSNPMGLELKFSVYAYTNVNTSQQLNPLNNTFFWEIEFTNVSTNNYDSVYVTYYIDADIGFAFDDFVRYNVDLNSMITYNATEIDGTGAPEHYGLNWPVASVGVVDGIESEYTGNVEKISTFHYVNNGACPVNCQPNEIIEYYNYARGLWKDGSPLFYGGNGVAAPSGTATNIPTKYMFPGYSDPNHTATNGVDPGWAWREEEPVLGGEQNPVGDRIGFMSTGPFKLEAGASKKITYMYHHTFDSTGMTTEEKIQKNRLEQMQLIEWFENNSFPSDCLGDGVLSVNEAKTKSPEIAIYPNPANTWLNVQVDGMKGHIAIEILDINGRVVLQHASTHSLTTLDLTPLKSGIYILRVNDGESLITKKLIVN